MKRLKYFDRTVKFASLILIPVSPDSVRCWFVVANAYGFIRRDIYNEGYPYFCSNWSDWNSVFFVFRLCNGLNKECNNPIFYCWCASWWKNIYNMPGAIFLLCGSPTIIILRMFWEVLNKQAWNYTILKWNLAYIDLFNSLIKGYFQTKFSTFKSIIGKSLAYVYVFWFTFETHNNKMY